MSDTGTAASGMIAARHVCGDDDHDDDERDRFEQRVDHASMECSRNTVGS